MKKLMPLLLISLLLSCNNDDNDTSTQENQTPSLDLSEFLTINFDALPDYNNQYIPAYITKDNTTTNSITNEGATLGRVLFYDTNLSSNNTVACASCHKQEEAFGDTDAVSMGVNGTTGRHSMRLINSRFATEDKFFWDERATTLEEQTTMPIQDHIEMGFSGEDGDASFDDLITKLENIEYYPQLFNLAFGSNQITESRMQNAISQFVRSIQSFDSKYDEGRLQANNDGQPFSNYTDEENTGKNLFFSPPVFDNQGIRTSGGIGCAGCHQAPEFDIDPDSKNNGVIGLANGATGTDFTITRSPSLRDVVKTDGTSNGPFMHIGVSNNLMTVLDHYDTIEVNGNTNLDPRLMPNGSGQQLNMTLAEKNAVIAFLATLSGTNVYSDERWSTPFIN